MVLAAASFLRQNVSFVHVENCKSKDFLAKSPLGRCPVLETPQGSLNQSNAIIRYFSYLAGVSSNVFENAQVDSWLNFSQQELAPVTGVLSGMVFGSMAFNSGLQTRAVNDLKSLLNFLNEHLKTRTVLVGYKISIADVSVAAHLAYAYQFLIDENMRKTCVNVTRWFSFVSGQDEWRSNFGRPHFCTKAWNFVESN